MSRIFLFCVGNYLEGMNSYISFYLMNLSPNWYYSCHYAGPVKRILYALA